MASFAQLFDGPTPVRLSCRSCDTRRFTSSTLEGHVASAAGLPEMTSMAYLASSGLCIGAIGCLANQKTARTGNALGLMGVAGGVAATLGAVGGDAPLYGQIVGEFLCMQAPLGASLQDVVGRSARLSQAA